MSLERKPIVSKWQAKTHGIKKLKGSISTFHLKKAYIRPTHIGGKKKFSWQLNLLTLKTEKQKFCFMVTDTPFSSSATKGSTHFYFSAINQYSIINYSKPTNTLPLQTIFFNDSTYTHNKPFIPTIHHLTSASPTTYVHRENHSTSSPIFHL